MCQPGVSHRYHRVLLTPNELYRNGSSQISAINTTTGEVSIISPVGGQIVGPDDLAFDSKGTLYATEVMSERGERSVGRHRAISLSWVCQLRLFERGVTRQVECDLATIQVFTPGTMRFGRGSGQ